MREGGIRIHSLLLISRSTTPRTLIFKGAISEHYKLLHHGKGQSGILSCFWNESLTGQHGKFMGPRFKKHSVLYFPEGREHPHLLATYVKLEPVCNVSSFPPYFKYSLYSSTCSMMTPRWRENICIEIKHEISYLDVSGALFHTIAQRSLLAMTPEEELL